MASDCWNISEATLLCCGISGDRLEKTGRETYAIAVGVPVSDNKKNHPLYREKLNKSFIKRDCSE